MWTLEEEPCVRLFVVANDKCGEEAVKIIAPVAKTEEAEEETATMKGCRRRVKAHSRRAKVYR